MNIYKDLISKKKVITVSGIDYSGLPLVFENANNSIKAVYRYMTKMEILALATDDPIVFDVKGVLNDKSYNTYWNL